MPVSSPLPALLGSLKLNASGHERLNEFWDDWSFLAARLEELRADKGEK
jgi:hypothetical protein